MASNKFDLASDVEFIKTPAPAPSKFEAQDCGVPTTDVSSSPMHCYSLVKLLTFACSRLQSTMRLCLLRALATRASPILFW